MIIGRVRVILQGGLWRHYVFRAYSTASRAGKIQIISRTLYSLFHASHAPVASIRNHSAHLLFGADLRKRRIRRELAALVARPLLLRLERRRAIRRAQHRLERLLQLQQAREARRRPCDASSIIMLVVDGQSERFRLAEESLPLLLKGRAQPGDDHAASRRPRRPWPAR